MTDRQLRIFMFCISLLVSRGLGMCDLSYLNFLQLPALIL